MANTIDTMEPEAILRGIIDGSLTELVDDVATSINERRFSNFTNLKSLSLMAVLTINSYSFLSCTSLEHLDIPKADSATNYVTSSFRECTALEYLVLPSFTKGSSYIFYICSSLRGVDLGNVGTIGVYWFQRCTVLNTLVLRRTAGITNLNGSVFDGTPFANGGSGGTIYIPKTYYDHLGDGTSMDYKTSTNWATLDGYGTVTWMPIEGSQYENYYVDGTPINSVGGVILNLCIYILIKYICNSPSGRRWHNG